MAAIDMKTLEEAAASLGASFRERFFGVILPNARPGILAGALMRFPLGLLSQYIGRKKATLVEMGMIMVAMLFGFFFVKSFNDLLAMGVLLGIAGASFGVALSPTNLAIAATGALVWLGWDTSAVQSWLNSTSAWAGESIEGAQHYLVSLLPSGSAAGVGGVLGSKRK